jgi:hypothetical protein
VFALLTSDHSSGGDLRSRRCAVGCSMPRGSPGGARLLLPAIRRPAWRS